MLYGTVFSLFFFFPKPSIIIIPHRSFPFFFFIVFLSLFSTRTLLFHSVYFVRAALYFWLTWRQYPAWQLSPSQKGGLFIHSAPPVSPGKRTSLVFSRSSSFTSSPTFPFVLLCWWSAGCTPRCCHKLCSSFLHLYYQLNLIFLFKI